MTNTNQLYNEADRLKDDGQYDAAIDKLQLLLAIDRDFVLAHSALAVLYGKVDRHDQAIEHGVLVSELETYQRAFAGTKQHKYIQMAEDAMAKSKMMTGHP